MVTRLSRGSGRPADAANASATLAATSTVDQVP
jgi:hypothetical protein